MQQEFLNLYRHGFVRLALGTPLVRVADPDFNAGQTVALLDQAHDARAAIVSTPPMCLQPSHFPWV